MRSSLPSPDYNRLLKAQKKFLSCFFGRMKYCPPFLIQELLHRDSATQRLQDSPVRIVYR